MYSQAKGAAPVNCGSRVRMGIGETEYVRHGYVLKILRRVRNDAYC